jgi:hypothetical protein
MKKMMKLEYNVILNKKNIIKLEQLEIEFLLCNTSE